MGNFFNYLVDRGYDREILKPLFLEASLKLTENPALKSNASNEEKRAFLHLKFHPFQISRMDIQDAFRKNCADVLKKAKGLDDDDPSTLGIQRLVVAQSRAPNLRDRLCRTTLILPEGRRASDLITHLKARERLG